MTMYTAPPNQNGLVLGDGDVLQVNNGGTATNTIVEGGGEVIVVGGAAVNTTLDGGREIVESGIADGVMFDGGDAVLSVADPASIHGTLIFDVPSGEVDYNIYFGTTVNSISSTSNTLTVNYGNNQSITYSYHLSGGHGVVSFDQFANTVRVFVEALGATAGHSPPGLSGHHSHGPPGHFHPDPFELFDARFSHLNHLSTPVIGLVHHLGGEFHL
jgi:autotransporter passenger strand-loop-strand repeat protein